MSRRGRAPHKPRPPSDFREKLLLSFITFLLTGCLGTFLSSLISSQQRRVDADREQRRYESEESRRLSRLIFQRIGHAKQVLDESLEADPAAAREELRRFRKASAEWQAELLHAEVLAESVDDRMAEWLPAAGPEVAPMGFAIRSLRMSLDHPSTALEDCTSGGDPGACERSAQQIQKMQGCATTLFCLLNKEAAGVRGASLRAYVDEVVGEACDAQAMGKRTPEEKGARR
jgi:hypothetical protein